MRKNILALATIGMLLLSSLMIMPKVGASGNTIYVDDDNTSGPWNGTQEYPCRNIQDGINNSDNGDTVFVYNGTYYENVIINKSINLVGEDKEITIVDGEEGEFVFNITADHVNVSGFTIQNGSLGIKIFNTSNNIITDNIVKENINYGISVYNWSNDSLIYRNNFIGNNAKDLGNNAYDDGYEGNYWDDFDEPSEGAYDNNSDRIVDTPYNISDGDNQDSCPLMFPFGEIPPVADFTPEVDGYSVQFHLSAYDRDGVIESYFWEFGDGTNLTEENPVDPVHEYDGDYNTYTVNLTVTDNDGHSDKISMSVTTGDTKPPRIHSIVPEKALYINNEKKGRTRLVRMALIVGDITIEVNATDNESGIKQVNFTIDPFRPFAKQVGNDTTAPYTYNWSKKAVFRFAHIHLINIDVIDNAGNIETKRIVVRRIL